MRTNAVQTACNVLNFQDSVSDDCKKHYNYIYVKCEILMFYILCLWSASILASYVLSFALLVSVFLEKLMEHVFTCFHTYLLLYLTVIL
jgi:hypothetical protein